MHAVSQPLRVVHGRAWYRRLDAVQHGDHRLQIGGRVPDRHVRAELVGRIVGQRPDDRHRRRARAQRKRVVAVVEQHQGTCRHGPRRGEVGRGEFGRVHPVRVGQRMVEHAREELQCQHVPHQLIHPGHADLAALHQVRTVGRVGGELAGDLDAHLDVHARREREPRGVRTVGRETEVLELLDRLVVADHRAAESPFLAQDRAEEIGIPAGGHAVERVERAHHRRGARVDRGLVRRQIDVAKLLLRHVDRVVLPASRRRAVRREVLHGGGHLVQRAEVAALVTADLRGRDRRAEERVLAGALDHTSPARVPADVDHRVEGPLDPVGGRLVRRDGLVVLDRRRIPAARLPDGYREERLVPVDDIEGEDDGDVQA